jgi:DUF438 domain-containing protein
MQAREMDKETLEEKRAPLVERLNQVVHAIDQALNDIEFLTKVEHKLHHEINLLTELIDEEYRREEEEIRAEYERQGRQAETN